jgi:hypothetical protein
VFENFDQISPVELIYALEFSGIEIDKSKL